MSYILDALNKSEEEKKQHRTPGLNTIHQSSEGRKTRRGPLLLIGIGLLIINLIGLLIWWIFFSVTPEPRDAGSISMQPTTSKPPPRVDSQRQSNTGTNNQQPINAETALRRESQLRLPSPSAPIQNPVGTNAIPQLISREIAAIRFSSHIFADDASLRRVVLNGQPLKEGNRFGSGLTLQQITEDGVILRYQRQTVAISVLSQWADD
ncbi:MAG: general secretion pathway protein GspB [Pseudomonadales bacterium]|nr:general secretion pathway protein GspB [Pseudomonadales bacterium]